MSYPASAQQRFTHWLKPLLINSVLLLLSLGLSSYGALYLYFQWTKKYDKPVLGILAGSPLVRKLFVEESFEYLMAAIEDERERGGYIQTRWDFDLGASLAKNIFVETEMYGERKYRYRPEITIFNGRVLDGMHYGRVITAVTPEIRELLNRNQQLGLSVYVETDHRGFKKTNLPELVDGEAVVFLGDSFTDGLFVASEQTFVAEFGRLARQDGLKVNPYNLGVSGYSPMEEAWMLEHFGPELKPRVVVVNLYPNDIHENVIQVTQGDPVVPEKNYQTMFHYLEKMQSFCLRQQCVLVVSVIPPFYYRGVSSYFQDRVGSWCYEKQIFFLDPKAYFSFFENNQIYFDWDPHFSPEGHRHYAAFLYENIAPLLSGADATDIAIE